MTGVQTCALPICQEKEIGETSVERPERMLLQMHQKRQKGTKQIASKKQKTKL